MYPLLFVIRSSDFLEGWRVEFAMTMTIQAAMHGRNIINGLVKQIGFIFLLE